MTKVLTFKVEIDGLENKIWRKIEITDRRTIADLVYTILATFESLAYHLYYIIYNGKIYDSWVCIEEDHSDIPPENAVITKLNSIGLKENDTMTLMYDTGTTTSFKITYLNFREFEKGNGMHYPYITDGQGSGMIDDISNDELIKVVDDIDKTDIPKRHVLLIDKRHTKLYDYRNFNLSKNNLYVRRYFHKIKYSYEYNMDIMTF